MELRNQNWPWGNGIREQKPIGCRDTIFFFFLLDQEIGQEWRVCSSGWQRWWSAALCMIGVDMSPCPGFTVHRGKTITMIDSSSVLVLLLFCLWRKSRPDVLEGGKQRRSSCLNTLPPQDPCLALSCVTDIFAIDTAMGLLRRMAAFNLHRKQSCHNCYHYPLHHYHQSCLKLIWRNHQWSAFISYANRLILYGTF